MWSKHLESVGTGSPTQRSAVVRVNRWELVCGCVSQLALHLHSLRMMLAAGWGVVLKCVLVRMTDTAALGSVALLCARARPGDTSESLALRGLGCCCSCNTGKIASVCDLATRTGVRRPAFAARTGRMWRSDG
jgi:hypothetical protein